MNPLQAAISGLGWEDLVVMFGITKEAAKAVIAVAETRRLADRRKVR